MEKSKITKRLQPLCLRLLIAAAGTGFALAGHAQVQKIVGPDGKVTYTDKVSGAAASHASGSPAASGVENSLAGLPNEIRKVSLQFPVVVYTTTDCSLCDQGIRLLLQRGVPFTERTVGGRFADQEAMRKLTGTTNLPIIVIGKQQLEGFSSVRWNEYLDLAGYPKTSQLPSTWRNPPATPLVPADASQAEAQAAAGDAGSSERAIDSSQP